MHSFPSFNKKVVILLRTHNQHGTDYTASAERTISTVALLYFPPYDTNRSIRSRLPFIYTHQDPLYICRNLTQSNRSCCQHLCIQTCHFHSPIPSADRTTTTLYSPTLTWHYPQQSGHLTIPRLPLSPRINHYTPNLTCHLTSRLRPETAILLRIQNLFDYHTCCPNPITLLRIWIYHLDRDQLLIPDILSILLCPILTCNPWTPVSHLNM